MKMMINVPEKVIEEATARGMSVNALVLEKLDQAMAAYEMAKRGSIIDLIAMPSESDLLP